MVDGAAVTVSEGSVTVDGLDIHYVDRGPGRSAGDRGLSVLLVHGLNAQLHTWDPIAEQLARRRRVVALDLRGHGDSDWTKQGYPLVGFVADIRGVLQHLELPRIGLVGHSLGARVCLAYAAEYPEAVGRLVLSDAGPELSRSAAKHVQGNARNAHSRGFRSASEALEFFREEYPDWIPRFHDLHVQYQLRLNWAGKYVWKSDPELFWLSGSAGRADDEHLWRACEQVTCPTLIMRGRRSYLLDERISRRMQELLKFSAEAIFDTGHYIPREAPDEFTRALDNFLTEEGQ